MFSDWHNKLCCPKAIPSLIVLQRNYLLLHAYLLRTINVQLSSTGRRLWRNTRNDMELHHGSLRLLLTGYKSTKFQTQWLRPVNTHDLGNTGSRTAPSAYARYIRLFCKLHCPEWLVKWLATGTSPSKETCPVSADYSGWILN
jgi:hypothetical protein